MQGTQIYTQLSYEPKRKLKLRLSLNSIIFPSYKRSIRNTAAVVKFCLSETPLKL